jgi:methionine-gamma-lyase
VFYPGIESHRQFDEAQKILDRAGAMLSFSLSSEEEAVRVLKALRLGSFAASLGGVRTVTQVPGTMAFLDIPEHEREAMGISAGMIRVSVGIESSRDIIEDFEQAMAG